MRKGQVRKVKLFLFDNNRPTRFFLVLQITCDRPGRTYYLDVNPSQCRLGDNLSGTVRLKLVKNKRETTLPVKLAANGSPSFTASFPLTIGEPVDKIEIVVEGLGSFGRLTTSLRYRT